MPKGSKSKKKKEKSTQDDGAVGGQLTVPALMGDDSDSICSSIPDSILSDEVISEGANESDGSSSDSELQFQLTEHIDQLADKNLRVRMSAISYLTDTLKHKMINYLMVGRLETVIDLICRGLRRSKGSERQDLLTLLSLVVMQFGEAYPELWPSLHPVLMSLLHDHSINVPERSAALSTLTLCAFLLCEDMKDVQAVMQECENIFSTLKIDAIVYSAVKGWTLLCSLLPSHLVSLIITNQLPQLTRVLQSSGDISLKIASGQAIALVFELAREVDEDMLDCDESGYACDVVAEVAAESNRYTGRKERNHQRASFRHILQSLETGFVPERSIKFGSESLNLNSWAKIIHYNTFTELLSTGTRMHLQNNELIREIFQLGPVPMIIDKLHSESKAEKIERKLINAASAKWRSQHRGKQRDKRAVI